MGNFDDRPITLRNKIIDYNLNKIVNFPFGKAAEVAEKSITDLQISDTAAIAWNKISKTGSSLSELSDIVLTNLQEGEHLMWDGSKWMNTTEAFTQWDPSLAEVITNKTMSFNTNTFLNFPFMTATSVDTITNKTVSAASNNIIDDSIALGDIMKSDGTSFVRFGIGSANQVLSVNSGGTDLIWAAAGGGGGSADPSTMTVMQDPTVKRTGYALPVNQASPSATNIVLSSGALASMVGTGTGTASVTLDTTEGLYSTHTSAASSGAAAGVLAAASTPGMCNTTFAGKLRSRFKVDSSTSARVYFGILNQNTLPFSDTPMANISTILVGYASTGGWSVFYNNNAGGGSTTAITGSPARDANWHTVEINWPTGGASFTTIFDGTSQTFSATDIPTTSDAMWVYLSAQTTSTTARALSTKGIWAEFTK